MPDTCQGPDRPGPLVTLNVGGKLYSTTLETLTRVPDSMLGAMFRDPQPALLDSCGNYFIDRDGKTFRHVLNFLRFGRLDLPEGYAELSLLRAEADFYQIRPLLHQLQRVEAERWRQRSNAVLHADVDLNSRRLHFNVRRGPQNYELSSCTVEIFTANVFCTDRHFLAVLRRYLGRLDCANGNVEEGSPNGKPDPSRRGLGLPKAQAAIREPGGWKHWFPNGDRGICLGDSTDEDVETDDEMPDGSSGNCLVETTACHHLCLEWAPCPAALPAAEYAKQKLRRLWVDGREIRSSNEFLEEVLKVALAQGFRVDSVFPDPADILNARSLRFVRH
ncbi:BTB/POZ domain-containing protein KCTD11 [Crotalus tigris]|uniref:BTB/POZ domain-containing protein KCTD11 n=1 Tax=Crotalus tigris TaxID=88082 RepID=UPI00192F841F|nr:BTB/POZ domain-containing protein KCTD11 [Crotalus tigris]XP_039193768.1 BTB/POZ domain-containing protein KCTD11 [Crotalus tigris]XP_039193769.1 BTB/POZ domain-containing protein KCTD11 [Crotalus tigris]XP_039193770.1 BTB/POZ domain-containing protein KCTD11 [Crotalus tigris]